jgi:hypothetical protein
LWPSSTEKNAEPYYDPTESNENTLFKVNCKLYLLEADKQNWVERGYGILKVIDLSDDLNCKIMMWTDKCFRLILHTKIFEKMQIDRANKKSIRFNAIDNGTIRIFLVKTGNPNDCDELFELLTNRLNKFILKSSKLTTNLNNATIKNSKSILFSCDCNISEKCLNEADESNNTTTSTSSKTIPAKIQLFTYTPHTTSPDSTKLEANNHQLLLDLVDRQNDAKIFLSTSLKLIKLKASIHQRSKSSEDLSSHPISGPSHSKKDSFEFEISESVVSFSSSEFSLKSNSKFNILIEDKELASNFLVFFNKEPKFRSNLDDSSQDDDENDQDDIDDQNTEDNDNEPLRKSNSINESERYGSSGDDEQEEEEENANDSCSIETGEKTNRKRKNYDSDNIPTAFKKQDTGSLADDNDDNDDQKGSSTNERKNSFKRNLDESSTSNQENFESSLKKTKPLTDQ